MPNLYLPNYIYFVLAKWTLLHYLPTLLFPLCAHMSVDITQIFTYICFPFSYNRLMFVIDFPIASLTILAPLATWTSQLVVLLSC